MPTAIYNQLSQTLEKFIREKELQGKLPGIHRLAAQLGANHITLRKAVEKLVDKGLLEVIPSRGIYVRKNAPKESRTFVIGFVGLYESTKTREFYTEELNDRLKRTGYRIMELPNNPTLFKKEPELLLRFPVDGFVFLGNTINRNILNTLLGASRKVICTVNPNFPEIPHVGLDHHAAYRDAIKILKRNKARKIAFLDYQRPPDFQNYLQDIRMIFHEELGLEADPELFTILDAYDLYKKHGDSYHQWAAWTAWQLWADNPPDAVITNGQLSRQLKDLEPRLTTVAFKYIDDVSNADIDMIADTPRLLTAAAQTVINSLNGNPTVAETRIPFIRKINLEAHYHED